MAPRHADGDMPRGISWGRGGMGMEGNGGEGLHHSNRVRFTDSFSNYSFFLSRPFHNTFHISFALPRFSHLSSLWIQGRLCL